MCVNDGRHHIVESDELLSAFRELARVTRIALKSEATRASLLFAYIGKMAGTGMTVAGGRSRVEMKNQNGVQVYLAPHRKVLTSHCVEMSLKK